MLDQLSALGRAAFPKDRLHRPARRVLQAFNGAGYDFGSLLDSGSRDRHDAQRDRRPTATLVDDSAPLLDSQAQSVDAIRTWARSVNGRDRQLAQQRPRSAHRA